LEGFLNKFISLPRGDILENWKCVRTIRPFSNQYRVKRS